MSVYTPVPIKDLEPITHARSLGLPLHLEGIAQGIINSNFRLTTERGTFILTLVENPEEARALPFVMQLLEKLGREKIPVPIPIKDDQGQSLFTLAGRPAVLVTLLEGVSPNPPNPEQCRQLGSWLGHIHVHGHVHGSPLPINQPDAMGYGTWEKMLQRLSATLDPIDQDIIAWFKGELLWLQEHWLPLHLPNGLCHSDLFPDNTLFDGNRLTGIIDFYSACHGPWLYDLAIALCSWCFDDSGHPFPDKIQALLAGYDQIRPRLPSEHDHLTTACRAAAFRFSLSRFHDHCFPKFGATVTRRNPESFMARLRTLQTTPLPEN